MIYTDAQVEAITAINKNLQIIACAGSGKTQVIAERTVAILTQGSVKPQNIVAFTFTEKAAAELKARITRIAREKLSEVDGMAEMYVGTIHGFCLDFLQTYLYRFLKYGVLSDIQTRLLISRNSRKSGLTTTEVIKGPSEGQTLNRNSSDVKLYLEVLNVIREDRIDLEALPDNLRDAYESYIALLDQHRYLDFSRIQLEAVRALCDGRGLNHLHAQEQLASRIKYVIVDEYQDVNPLQETLISRLHELGANICVVGDDDQTIYQWRGSEVYNIIGFENRYPDVNPVKMGENFRSSRGVVNTARDIAKYNTARLSKPIVAAGHQEFGRGDLLGLTFDDPESEADWIAEKIGSMRGVPFQDAPSSEERGLAWSDFAILLRSVRNDAGPIVDALQEADIPLIIKGFSNLFDAEEIRACVALFDFIVEDIDTDAVTRLWRNARVGVTDDDLNAGLVVLEQAKNWGSGERWAAYNIQRVYLDFLEAVNLREERVPSTPSGDERGEIVYANLGKFSQVISDFEQIHFQSAPEHKYETFAWWLHNEAPEYYEEGTDAEGMAQPNAVQIMTVHQAKGMEWPVVFVPALRKNRFPARRQGGRNKWHVLPRQLVENADRYDGSIEDERRLFYVALTRSEKYLFVTFSPVPDHSWYKKPSPFFKEFTSSSYVLTRDPNRLPGERIEPLPRRDIPPVVLSFSELKYFYQCPYQFKLRFLYGFNPPLHEALGYGKSIHDALAEMHKRAQSGDIMSLDETEELVDRHLHTPFAYPDLEKELRSSAIDAIDRYIVRHGEALEQVRHTEKQIEIQIEPHITVLGRVDLIKRLDTGEVSIVDFKSSDRAQAEEVTTEQLHSYALGYKALTGESADLLEVLNLDEEGRNVRQVVDPKLLSETSQRIRRAGSTIRENTFERHNEWCHVCDECDLAGICRTN